MHLAAIEAHLRVRGSLPVNVKVVVEGEEEIGSPNFDAAVERYRDAFASDRRGYLRYRRLLPKTSRP